MPITDEGINGLIAGDFGDAALHTSAPPTLMNEVSGGGYSRQTPAWGISGTSLAPQGGLSFPAPTADWGIPLTLSVIDEFNRLQAWVQLEDTTIPVVGTPYVPDISRVFLDLSALDGFTPEGLLQVYGIQFIQNGWISLHSGVPEASNELSGDGYGRVRASAGTFSLRGTQTLSNASDIIFPNPTGNWNDVSHVGIWSSETGGDLWVLKELLNPVEDLTTDLALCISADGIEFDFSVVEPVVYDFGTPPTGSGSDLESRVEALERGVFSDDSLIGSGREIDLLGVDYPHATEEMFGNTDNRLPNSASVSGTAAPGGNGVWVDIVSARTLATLEPGTMTTGGNLRGTIHYDLELQFGAVPIKYRTRIRNNGVLIHTIHFTGDPDSGSADFQIPLRDISNPTYTYDLAFQAIGTNYTLALSATNLVVHRGDGAASAAVRAEVSRDTQALAQMVSDLQDAVAALQGDA